MQYIDIFKTAAENTSFLKILFTQKNMQVAISSLKPGEETGEEVRASDVVILVISGQGHITVGGEEHDIASGDLVCVPADTTQKVINLGIESLKLLFIFSSAVLKDGTNEGSQIAEIMDPYKVRGGNDIV